MNQSNSERFSGIMKIVNEIAASVVEASGKVDAVMSAQLKAAAKTLMEHAEKNSGDVEELFDYLRNAKNYGPGEEVDNAATLLGAKTLAQRWDEIKAIYYDP